MQFWVLVKTLWNPSFLNTKGKSGKESTLSSAWHFQRAVNEQTSKAVCRSPCRVSRTFLYCLIQWGTHMGYKSLGRAKVSSSKLVQAGRKMEWKGLLMCWVWKAPVWEEKAEGSQVHWKQDIIEGVNKPDSAAFRNGQYAGVSSSGCFFKLPGQLKDWIIQCSSLVFSNQGQLYPKAVSSWIYLWFL